MPLASTHGTTFINVHGALLLRKPLGELHRKPTSAYRGIDFPRIGPTASSN